MKHRHLLYFLAVFVCWSGSPQAKASEPVLMFPETGELQPGSTIEFRFPEAIVGSEDLGPALDAPVVFSPALSGDFTWLSTRSGVFRPVGPVPLGTTWKAGIRPGLKTAEGAPVPQDFNASLSTPPFGVTAVTSGVWDADNVSSDVNVRIAFNAPVAADASFIRFINGEGKTIPALVRHARPDDFFQVPPTDEEWDLRWQLARDPAAQAPGREEKFPSRLFITPATPIPPGSGWELVVDAGLPSKSGELRLPEPYQVSLGTVIPFTLAAAETDNFILSGPTLTMQFSSALAPDINDSNAGEFFNISPPPENPEWEIGYDSAILRAKFQLGRDYKLTIGEGVVSSIGQPLDGQREHKLVFKPVTPRLYLPELTMAQIVGGRRKMPVRSVNLDGLRVKAVLIPPERAAKALALFKQNEWKYDEEEPIPVKDLGGKVLFNENLPLTDSETNGRQLTELDWDQLLGGRKAGIVYLELKGTPLPSVGGKPPAAQALIQLTDLGILWRKTGDTIRTFVFSNTTALPVEGAKAQLLDAEFKALASAPSDAAGNADLTYTAVPEWLLVTSKSDACVLRMGPNADALRAGDWFSASWTPQSTAASALRAMIFTDRPIYKPGETVHVKGFVRRSTDEGPGFMEPGELNLVLRNPEFQEVRRLKVAVDELGAFNTDFELPFSPVGNYGLVLELPGSDSGTTANFLVAEYQPDAFEVSLNMPDTLPPGSPAPQAVVDGSYFFGGKLTSADVRWTLRYFRSRFYPVGFDSFHFLDDDEEDEAKPLTQRGEAQITGGQPVTIKPELPTPELSPFSGVLTAEITDLNQQTVSTSTEFTREASDFYLGIARPEERVVRAGDEVGIPVAAVRPDGQPLPDPVDITIRIDKHRFNVVRVLGAGGAMTFRRDLVKEPLLEEKAKTVPVTMTLDTWSAGDLASLRFKTATTGHHQVTVTARDSGGRKVSSSTSFYVYGKEDTVWDYSNPAAVTLIPDKESYLPGETARVLVQTPIGGQAHVGIERASSILRSMRLPIEGNSPVIEIPITESDAPGVTVSLVILRGSEASPRKFPTPDFRYGVCKLKVEQPAAELRVSITPAQERVLPGAEVSADITVQDHLGRAVPKAGVTFYAVDDGVLALTGFERPDPAAVFLAPVGTRVLTGLSLSQLLPEDPDDIEFSNKGYLIGGGGEGGPVAMRQNFPGTACWIPSLVTDADGRATARFTAPDALTRYRLVAVAASGPAAFGTAESAVEIARPLMILPSIGQFANAGDRLVARAVVRNETGRDGSVVVELKTSASTDKITLEIPEGSARAADFTLSFRNPGTAELEWSATMESGDTKFADRVKTSLPVRSPMLQLRETYFTALEAASNNLLDGVNPQVTEGRGDVAVTVANTRLASLGANARYLATYPYGCAEQRTSALVPWVLMPVLGPLMPGLARDPAETHAVITRTVAELFELQAPDGGIGFWPGSRESSPFASAWAAIVISYLEENDIPPARDKLLDYLEGSLRGIGPATPPSALADRTFAALALALSGRPASAYHEELYRRRAELPLEARTVLALAILKSDGPRTMAGDLLKPDTTAPAEASPYGSSLRERAIRLLALTAYDPKGADIGPLVAELLAFGPRGASGTTQSNAWALLAFAGYHSRVEQSADGSREAQGTIVSGSDTLPFKVDKTAPAFREDFAFAPGTTGNVLRVDNPSTAPLFGETSFTVFPPLGEQPPQDRGFAVSRSYRKIGDDGSLQPAEDLRVGDRLVVTLRVETARPAHFVVIDDPLPSILEAVNPEFISREVGHATDTTPWQVDHREVLSDRVVYFCDALPPGAFTFEYLARVRMAGEATAAATKAEAMYRPERFGLGAINRLTSKSAETR